MLGQVLEGFFLFLGPMVCPDLFNCFYGYFLFHGCDFKVCKILFSLLAMEKKTMHSLLPALKMKMRTRMRSPRKLPGPLIRLPLIIIRGPLLQMKK